MPALKNCPEFARRRARIFVENHCINHRKCKDSSVHNMCFFLYSRSANSSEMLDYLKKEENKIIAGQNVYLDLTYALNEAKKQQIECERNPHKGENAGLDSKSLAERVKNLKKAQITLYGIMKVYGKAVELALEVSDIGLARDYANKPMNRRIQQELWMKIATHLFKGETQEDKGGVMGVQDALTFIRENSRLRVEDLLETFPKTAKVEEMKEHLCRCLEDYERKLINLRAKIEKNSYSAD